MDKPKKPTYDDLGVSHQKEDVHAALKYVHSGLFPNSFCKIIPDLAQNEKYCSIMHADGAGTKSTLAYIMYKETGNVNFFKGIVQDAIVMNVDDILCVGVDSNSHLLLSNTIGREKKLISGEIISVIINAYEEFLEKLRSMGLPIYSCGGETADVGDLVRTIMLDSTLVARMERKNIIIPRNIENGDVIVGLSSFGKTAYEDIPYNSGIGSNGLTLARHGVLKHDYYKKYPECYSSELDERFVFFGKYAVDDTLPGTPLTVGEAILSPTRTYTPIMLKLFVDKEKRKNIHAIYHNTGGGQSKCLKYGENIHYIKDNLFETPPFFKLIQESSGTDWREMYQVFNMGHRMEIICPEKYAVEEIIPVCNEFELNAKIIGRIEKINDSLGNKLTIKSKHGEFVYLP